MSRLPEKTRIIIMIGAGALMLGLLLLPTPGKQHVGAGVWGLLVLLAIGAMWFLKKRNRGREPATHMQVVEQLTLEQGRTLHLVQVDGQMLLLASHQSGIGLVSVCEQRMQESKSGLDKKDDVVS